MTWLATVLTQLPEMFPGPLDASLIGKARATLSWSLEVRDIREHGLGKHRRIDDTPSGGGPGMVMRADAAAAAIDAARPANDPRPLIYPSPRGVPFTQALAARLAQGPGVVIMCCRFEGLDERIIEARAMEEISLGDFVLAGGEVAAMAMLEACVRLISGVVGDEASVAEESFSEGLLEYPHYTRPQDFEGREIPEVLNSGNHADIARWRRAQAEAITRARRPDLWALYEKRAQSAKSPHPKSTAKTKARIARHPGHIRPRRRPPMNLIQTLEKEQMQALRGDRKLPLFPAGRHAQGHVQGRRRHLRRKGQAAEDARAASGLRGRVHRARGRRINESFTVRKISYGEGVERVFPVYSPLVDSVEVVRHGKVRRAKLYYLRGRRGKKARIAERQYTAGEGEGAEETA